MNGEEQHSLAHQKNYLLKTRSGLVNAQWILQLVHDLDTT